MKQNCSDWKGTRRAGRCGTLVLLACAWLTSATAALAQAPAPAPAPEAAYDLAGCIRAAIAASNDLGAAAADLALARARLARARAGYLGEIEYTQYAGVVSEAHGTVLDPRTDKQNYFDGLGPFTRIDLSINLPLWTFGKLDAAFEAATRAIEAEAAAGDSTRAKAVLDVKRLYYGLLLSRQLASVLHDMLDAMDKALKKAEERLAARSPAITEIDVLNLRVGRSKFAKGVAEIDASAELARSALGRAVGLGPGAAFDVAERKLVPVEAEIGPVDAYLAEGIERLPEWRQLSNGLAAQEARVELESTNYYPTIFVATGVRYAVASNRDEQDNPFASDDFNYLYPVGVLGVRWDLNFLATGAKVEEERAALERLQAQKREASSGLQLAIRRAHGEVLQHREEMRAMEDGRKAGRSLMVATVANFDLGIGEADEIFRGLGAYTETSSDYLRAVHDYNVAVGTLSRAVGRELTALQY